MSTWSRALVWSLIAAAFIGPGTVTTAAKAGSEGGWQYLAFVALAALAGFLLMEMVARLTLVSNQSLGQILGRNGKWLAWLCFGAVLLGCMAYQAGNLLGALSGVQLVIPRQRIWVLLIGAMAAIVLWPGESKKIARALAGVVTLMGLVFMVVATGLIFSGQSLIGQGTVATGTIIGLVGTTIVPYNFFLAAGLGRGESLGDMRRGLSLSFLVGALITGSIVLVGSGVTLFTGFADLARTLDAGFRDQGALILGIGLFAAGFSSAVTAPLAAALAGRELLADGEADNFGPKSFRFRIIWLVVLAIGLVVALLELDIITVILAAQVANGLLLPFIAGIVLVFANDRGLLGDDVNAWWQNGLGFLVATFLAQKNATLLLDKVGIEGIWPGIIAAGVYGLLLVWLMGRRRSV
jgi:manganese transport protein